MYKKGVELTWHEPGGEVCNTVDLQLSYSNVDNVFGCRVLLCNICVYSDDVLYSPVSEERREVGEKVKEIANS